jgi:hypothetical protein
MTTLTVLEERLAQAGATDVQQQLLEQLEQSASRLRQQLASSVPRSAYADHVMAIEALQAAQTVLRGWPIGPTSEKDPQEPLPALKFPSISTRSFP